VTITFGFFGQKVTAKQILAGVQDYDDGSLPELGVNLPWTVDPIASWLDYRCWIECYLDSGLVLHKSLPQTQQDADTLGSISVFDPKLDEFIGGVNLVSEGKYTDTIQRMATSEYRFCLRGWGTRAAYQIPVPYLISVGGVPAFPDDSEKQYALGNVLRANYSGIPVFFNAWKLWYTIAVPPTKAQVPPPNVAEHLNGDAQPPSTAMAASYGQPDQNAVRSPPPEQFRQ
jgi:hypothetical protein